MDVSLEDDLSYDYDPNTNITLPIIYDGDLPEGVEFEYVYINQTLSESSTEYAHNAGTYLVTATMKENDLYEVLDTSKLSVTLTINKINSSINVTDNQEKVYNGNNQEPSVSSWVGNSISKSFSRDGGNTYSATAPNEATTYKVKYTITGGINYNDVETIVNFKITQANPVISWPTLTGTYYEGNSVSTTGTAVSGVSGSWSNAGIVYGQWIDGETRNDGIVYANYGYVNGNNALPSKIYVTFKQTSNSNYLSEVSAWIDINVLPVAYNGTYYYGTIEKALLDSNTTLTDSTSASINTGTTIYVIPGTNPTIRNDATVKANTSLILPYEGENYLNREGSINKFADETIDSINTYRKNNVTIANNKVLTVNGTLSVGGILGAQGLALAGNTSGMYTQITLGSNSIINSTGTINCFGYIKEASANNGSQVNVNSGTINAPFVVYDYRAGTSTAGAYKGTETGAPIFPVNTFDMPNVQSLLTVKYGAQYIGYVDLYTGKVSKSALGVTATINARHNTSEITIVGTNGLFKLSNNASVQFKYTPKYEENDKKEKIPVTVQDKVNGRTKITFTGGATMGEIVLTINAADDVTYEPSYSKYLLESTIENMLNTSISTNTVFFPISWKFDFVLGNGTYSIPNKVKMLPGSSLTINSNATLNLSSQMNVYSSLENDQFPGAPQTSYPTGKGAAKLIVNGIMNVTGSLGGKVTSANRGAILNLSSSSSLSVTSYEGYGELDGLTPKFVSTSTHSLNVNGILYTDGQSLTNSNFAKASYKYNGTGWYTAGNATITFIPNYGSLTGGTSSSTTTSVTITDGSGFTIPNYGNQGIAAPTHYYFDGWYLDSSCNTLASGKTIWSNTTLYAKWTPITYTIEYVFDYGQYEGSIDTSGYTNSFTCLTDDFVLATPNVENYTFDGWYLDTTYTTNNKLTSFNFEKVAGSISNNKVTLYARLLSASININFITNNSDYDDFIVENVPADLETIRNVSIWNNGDISVENDNPQYSKYFKGWYYNNGETPMLVSSLSDFTDDMLNSHIDTLTDITIYGVWEDKVHIIYNDYQNGVTDYSTVCDDVYIKASEVSSYSLPDINDNNGVDTYSHYFYGWYKEQSHTNIYGSTINTTPNPGDTINIYGYWSAKLIVTFMDNGNEVGKRYDLAGGSITTLSTSRNNSISGTYGTSDTVTVTRYTFTGWNTNPVNGNNINANTSYTVTESITLYAQYSSVSQKYYKIFASSINNSTVTITINNSSGYFLNSSLNDITTNQTITSTTGYAYITEGASITLSTVIKYGFNKTYKFSVNGTSGSISGETFRDKTSSLTVSSVNSTVVIISTRS